MEGIIINIFLLTCFIGIAALFSAVEIALVNLSPSQIRRIIKQEIPRGRCLLVWEKNPDKILITIAIGNNLMNIAASAVAVTIFIRALPQITIDSAAAIATFVTTLLVLIFGEITPKLLGKRHSVSISLAGMPILIFLTRIFSPVSGLIWKVSRGILRILKKEIRESYPFESHREEIKALLELGKKEGVLSDKENKMLVSILHLADTKVGDIMVNRMNMICIEISSTYEDVLDVVRTSGFSRIPVYEKNVENIRGILMAKDILDYWEKKSFRLASLLRPAKFMPEVITIDRALREFIATQTHLAIVVNEYGEVEGLVTLEDVIEEITGDIQDEYDTESVLVKKIV